MAVPPRPSTRSIVCVPGSAKTLSSGGSRSSRPRNGKLSSRPPVTVKTERHAMRQFGDRDRPLVKPGCVKNREVAPLVRPPIDRSEQITVALGRGLGAWNKNRLRHEIALGQLISHPLASLEIDVRESVERIERFAVAARREISVAVMEASKAFVKPRKFAREIIDLLAFEAAGI